MKNYIFGRFLFYNWYLQYSFICFLLPRTAAHTVLPTRLLVTVILINSKFLKFNFCPF